MVIENLIDLIQKLGFTQLELELSDVRIIDILIKKFHVSFKRKKAIKSALYAKNISKYRQLIKELSFNDHDFNFYNDWPLKFGLYEKQLTELPHIPEIKNIVNDLEWMGNQITDTFPDIKITFDLSAEPKRTYYSGMFFKLYSREYEDYVFSGGRYDNLIRSYDQKKLSAVGAGINVDLLSSIDLPPLLKEKNSSFDPLVFVLAKGRVEKDARKILSRAGIDVSSLKDQRRKLIFTSKDGRFRFILVKPDDVLKYLDQGIGDLGIVGSDTIFENDFNHYNVADLKTGRAEFVLASVEKFDPQSPGRKKIATKYPKVTKDFFEKSGQDVEIIKLQGSVELAPITGLADAIVDIKQTGQTLKENNLKVFEEICSVSSQLVVSKTALQRHKKYLTDLIEKIWKITKESTYENSY